MLRDTALAVFAGSFAAFSTFPGWKYLIVEIVVIIPSPLLGMAAVFAFIHCEQVAAVLA